MQLAGISKKAAEISADGAPHPINSPGVISVSTTYEINIDGVPYRSATEIAHAHG
jgi:hypothetical protein